MENMKSPKTVRELVEAVTAGALPDYLLFWGHQPSPDGDITKTCFSQWWVAPFSVDRVEYRTAEHFMMAAKARLFGDSATLQRILAAKHPKEAQELGRSVKDFNEATWLERRYEFVLAGNLAKFSQHPDLKSFLLLTGKRILVEASPVDSIWGVGLAANSIHATHPEKWQGLNLLGFALMEVREQLS